MALGDLILFLTYVCQEQFDPWQRANLMSHSTLMSFHLMKYYINELSKTKENLVLMITSYVDMMLDLCVPQRFVWIWVLCFEYGYSVLSTLVGRGSVDWWLPLWGWLRTWLTCSQPCGVCAHQVNWFHVYYYVATESWRFLCNRTVTDICEFVIMGKWLHIPTDLIHMYWCVAQWIWRVSVHLKWLWIMWTWLWFHHNLLCNWPEFNIGLIQHILSNISTRG